MDEYIGRELLKSKIRAAFPSLEDRCRINEIVNSIPAADVKPVVWGKWEERNVEGEHIFFNRRFYCSACGGWNTYGKPKYCPNCGAQMREETEK